ncbi:hypothetical protein K402DRAFT_180550 [Aulographum hederae CBS 113979]|uniref:Uncharacterized protein n=1 Tax=Aulographum hederae CBS 113979 TaxID=1176131 RepID=A0A6G1GPV8_9PEZI|nr:hypothetical protein K402DRAFT_180550 [Aulographum hederae CBS 113979]
MHRLQHSHINRHARSWDTSYVQASTHQFAAIELPTRSIEQRSPGSQTRDTSSATTSCNDSQENNTCQKPTDSSATLPIALGAAIPIVCALVVLFILHRRHVRKQRAEDLADPHKSLDFGLDPAAPTGTKKKGKKGGKKDIPEMVVTDTDRSRRIRGMSMDMDLGSPYILPGNLNSSRESVRSMSRSMNDEHDPYRPVTFMKGDNPQYPRMRGDNSSVYTGSSLGTDVQANLLKNAQNMSQSFPKRGDSKVPSDNASTVLSEQTTLVSSPQANSSSKEMLNPTGYETERDSYSNKEAQMLQKELHYPLHHSQDQLKPTIPTVNVRESAMSPDAALLDARADPANHVDDGAPPRLQSYEANVQSLNSSFMGDFNDFNLGNMDLSQQASAEPPRQQALDALSAGSEGLTAQSLAHDPRRLSVRPLPPDEPNENPEERANRIRSFYKEYFDDSKTGPQPSKATPAGGYYEDYGQEYLNEVPMVDPASGNFVVAARAPFAQPMTRRAMTPPPRAPPKFRGNGSRHTSNGSGQFPLPRGHMSSGSSGMHPPRGRSATQSSNRRPLPPPAPLTTLPTPHMLKDDNIMLFNPLDFAPPPTFKDRQAGRRPQSPLGEKRPYSPSVRPHTPLASSFDELAPMPSPHMLRKSGTFTALDFAPPGRVFRGDNGSDAGSIRSARSGVSTMHNNAMRAGAYRVSRIPKEVAGSKDDLAAALKPKWDMNR